MNKYCLLGYSGHSYVIAESVLSFGGELLGYYDVQEAVHNPYNLLYLGDEKKVDIQSFSKTSFFFPSVGDSILRSRMVRFMEDLGLEQGLVVHDSVLIARNTLLGKSTFVGPRVVLNPCARIGKGCIINTGVIIEHECVIGDFTHVAPGAVLAGGVSVGNFSFIGANSTVREGIRIGNNVLIGAGSVVVKDVPDDAVCMGNPCRSKNE